MANGINVIFELKLITPYSESLSTLISFASLWHSHVLSGSTHSPRAVLTMPANTFKTIFGTNPVVGPIPVPSGTDNFINELSVTKVIGV